MSVSAVQQSESATCIHISPLLWISFPFRSPQSTEFPVLYSRFSLVIYFIHSSVYTRPSQSPSSTPASLLVFRVFVLYLCASISALQIKINYTTFLATHSSTLAWKMPWTQEPGRLQSMGSLGVGHDWATSLSLSYIGEGNGNPLQYSCLENPRDRGAWWAAIDGVA